MTAFIKFDLSSYFLVILFYFKVKVATHFLNKYYSIHANNVIIHYPCMFRC